MGRRVALLASRPNYFLSERRRTDYGQHPFFDCRQLPAVDNNGGKDFVLLSFHDFAVATQLRVGWASGDAGVQYWVVSTVWPDLDGLNLANLGDRGFGSPNIDEGNTARTFDVLGGGGFALLVSGQLDESNNCFKIKKLMVDYCPPEEGQVPEPASMGLVGASIVGLAIYRRRRNG